MRRPLRLHKVTPALADLWISSPLVRLHLKNTFRPRPNHECVLEIEGESV